MNDLKQAYDKMTDTQKFGALFSDPLTGALNRRAFELTDSDYVAIIDLDSLKWVNDNLGHRAGDVLLTTVAVMLKDRGFDVYRLSGDEFAVRGNRHLAGDISDVQNLLEVISVGVGTDLETADINLRKDKAEREERGLRSPRGVRPPWMGDDNNMMKFSVYGDTSNG